MILTALGDALPLKLAQIARLEYDDGIFSDALYNFVINDWNYAKTILGVDDKTFAAMAIRLGFRIF